MARPEVVTENPEPVNAGPTEGKRKRRGSTGPRTSEFHLLYESDQPINFLAFARASEAKVILEEMSKANREGRKVQFHSFTVQSAGPKAE